MLCIAVSPESRRLGKVDLFNAAPQCDLIEFRLDRLGKEPDLKEMMDGIAKPILISCRRKSDGGGWDGTEEERVGGDRRGGAGAAPHCHHPRPRLHRARARYRQPGSPFRNDSARRQLY